MYVQKVNNENLNKRVFDRNTGPFDIPFIKPEMVRPEELDQTEFISFNYVKTETHPEDKGVHFYLDDYQFQRVWNNIDKYVPMLRRFRFVLSPDFSTFTDWPTAVNIYNHYRKHWVGAYLQEWGVRVIPSISWAKDTDGSYGWCFDGEPIGSVVSVSSVGCCSNMESIDLFQKGFDAMYQQLKPQTVLFFGNRIIDSERYGCEFVFKETLQTMRFKTMKKHGK